MKRLAIVGAAVALMCGTADADYISAITPQASPIATFGPIVISPSLSGQVANNDTLVPSPNTVSMGITFTEFGTAAANVLVERLGGTPAAVGVAEYFFSLAITNASNHPISSLRIRLLPAGGPLPFPIPFFDVPMTAPSPIGGTGPQYQAAAQDVVNTWFGGLAGGGGEIPIGGTQVFTFSVDTHNTNFPQSEFLMTFTVNPEPGTMALAGLALGAGGLYVRRRKQVKAVA